MDQTTDIQASEELTLPGNHAAASADGLVVDNANDSAGQEEGFEIVLKDDEKPKQDPATNAEFARRRIERKRQRELEQQMEAVKRGELPEHLRVNPELPKQPDPNDYLSEDALAKYDYDQSRALAAFQQANSEWQIKAMDARSQAVAEQGRKTQEFTQQSAQYVEAARKHYDAAEKLNIPDYQEKEDAFMQLVPPAVGADIMRLFTPLFKADNARVFDLEVESSTGVAQYADRLFLSATTDGINYGREQMIEQNEPFVYDKRVLWKRVGRIRKNVGFKLRVITKSPVTLSGCQIRIE